MSEKTCKNKMTDWIENKFVIKRSVKLKSRQLIKFKAITLKPKIVLIGINGKKTLINELHKLNRLYVWGRVHW